MISKHAAAGRLQSGLTLRSAVQIFSELTTATLDQLLGEVARRVEHRGRTWTKSLQGIEDALDERFSMAETLLERPFEIAGGVEPNDALTAIRGGIETSRLRLFAHLQEFRDGWTSPTPKPWKDRYPFLYAVILAGAGALVGYALRSLPSPF